ncbi:hypothetical protein T484DRAFT_1767407 [Baffinella frigidus]|nr:hypothetical protein T484DRAFT_1767407 [Cryptophyta sp. CCMP2293]
MSEEEVAKMVEVEVEVAVAEKAEEKVEEEEKADEKVVEEEKEAEKAAAEKMEDEGEKEEKESPKKRKPAAKAAAKSESMEEDDGGMEEKASPKKRKTAKGYKEDDGDDDEETPDSAYWNVDVGQKRERKSLEVFHPEGAKVKEAVVVEKGKGTQLKNISSVVQFLRDHAIKKTDPKDPLKPRELKENILDFSGLTFTEDKQNTQFQARLDKLTIAQLKEIMACLALERGGTHKDLVDRLFDFLKKPSEAQCNGTAPRGSSKKRSKPKAKASKPKAKASQVSKKKSKPKPKASKPKAKASKKSTPKAKASQPKAKASKKKCKLKGKASKACPPRPSPIFLAHPPCICEPK